MEHLNFCRHMVKHLTKISQVPSVADETKSRATHLIDLASSSQKFMLPPGGVLLDDMELRGLDGMGTMRLPHQSVALEYQFKDTGGKAITFVREIHDLASIAVTPVFWAESNGCWTWFPTFFLPNVAALAVSSRSNGKASINFIAGESMRDAASKQVLVESATVVLAFLNALQCANVHVAEVHQKKPGKKVKAALQFDTYHVLTIDVPGRAAESSGPTGPHRAPREHLRRGHIRRLQDGRRIWVNATVVAAGRGAGVVKKDYALRLAA